MGAVSEVSRITPRSRDLRGLSSLGLHIDLNKDMTDKTPLTARISHQTVNHHKLTSERVGGADLHSSRRSVYPALDVFPIARALGNLRSLLSLCLSTSYCGNILKVYSRVYHVRFHCPVLQCALAFVSYPNTTRLNPTLLPLRAISVSSTD